MSATATDDRFWSKVDGADPLGCNLRRLVPRTEMRPPMTMDTATERTSPIGTLILITDDEMRDILTHIAGAGDRVLFDRLRDRWTSLRYGTRSGPEVPAKGRVVGARHTTLRIPL